MRLPKFFRLKGKPVPPPTEIVGRTGDARFVPQIAERQMVGRGRTARGVVMAHRLDSVSIQDYDRVRFYPVVRDGLMTMVGPLTKANVHFSCARPEIASLAQQELGPLLPNIVRQLLLGGWQFGYQVLEKRWVPKFAVSVTHGQQQGGESVERFYPFVWTLARTASFSPQDTKLLIDPLSGDFAGVRQFRGLAERRDVPGGKCIHWASDQEFDGNYGVPKTKSAVPFVELAESVYDSMVLYAAIFASPWKVGRYPSGKVTGRDAQGAASVTENADLMQGLVENIESAHSISLPSDVHDGGAQYKWDVDIKSAPPGENGYVEMLGKLDDMIRLAIVMPEMASSSTPDSGTYNLGEAKIALFLQAMESKLDMLGQCLTRQLCDDFRVYNFGPDAPLLTLHFEPLDLNVMKALLQALVNYLSQGEPLQDADGNLIYPDWAKIAQDKGVPITTRSGASAAESLLRAAADRLGKLGDNGEEEKAGQPHDLSFSEWRESEHPRDSHGRFVHKDEAGESMTPRELRAYKSALASGEAVQGTGKLAKAAAKGKAAHDANKKSLERYMGAADGVSERFDDNGVDFTDERLNEKARELYPGAPRDHQFRFARPQTPEEARAWLAEYSGVRNAEADLRDLERATVFEKEGRFGIAASRQYSISTQHRNAQTRADVPYKTRDEAEAVIAKNIKYANAKLAKARAKAARFAQVEEIVKRTVGPVDYRVWSNYSVSTYMVAGPTKLRFSNHELPGVSGGVSAVHGYRVADIELPVTLLDPVLPFDESALEEHLKGLRQDSQLAKFQQRNGVLVLADALRGTLSEWDETKHPRDPDGQFATTDSGAGPDSSEMFPLVRSGSEWSHGTGGAVPEHIRRLPIPPGWTEVVASVDPDADLLVKGKDSKGRAQRIYSDTATSRTAAAKFERIRELMTKMDEIRSENETFRASVGPRREAADALALVMATGVRPGSDDDTGAKIQAYGATTLRAEHVVETPSGLRLQFVGKKGVPLDLPVPESLAPMLKERAAKGGRLFDVSDSKLREHVHGLDGGHFKTKDFRTYIGTSTAINEVAAIGRHQVFASQKAMDAAKRSIARKVAIALGNTPSVALASYIDPSVFFGWSVHSSPKMEAGS